MLLCFLEKEATKVIYMFLYGDLSQYFEEKYHYVKA